MYPAENSARTGLAAEQITAAFADALSLARQWRGATSPNPPVGCVLLDAAGETLSAAAHRRAGESHAEALAIAQCVGNGSVARIHTVIVTLEPCNHQGRTPPCTQSILNTPARSVWIGVTDPNPHIAGGGARQLASAGLDVHFLADTDSPKAIALYKKAQQLLAPFSKHVQTGRPWVTIKQAITSTGSMIPPSGQKTFTGPAALDLAHRRRKRADAVLTGSGTILADAPEFTVRRLPDFPGKQRHIVIMDRRGRVSPAYLRAAEARGFRVSVETNLEIALERLGAAGCLEVLVEAGMELTQTILASALWDEHIIIRQAVDPNTADSVTTRYRAVNSHQEVTHVFRDH